MREIIAMEFGFIGLGQMGAPMASNLARHHRVSVYDQKISTESLAAGGELVIVKSAQELVSSDVILLSLPNAEVVEEVLFGAAGIADNLRPGTTVVDTGTTSYSATLAIGQRLANGDIRFIDAPVTGMRARAEDGTLTMMCGGDPDTIATLEPALSTMASTIIHTGAAGTGQLTKLINQLLFDINAAALAEILPLAAKLGLDPVLTADVVNRGTGRSYASETFIPSILEGRFDRGYPLGAAYKDLVSGSEISSTYKIPAPVLAAATATYQQALLEGHAGKDKGALILVFERLLDVAFRSNISVDQDNG